LKKLNQFIRNFNVVGVTNDNGEFYGGVFGTLQTIKLLAQTFHPNILVWCWEGRNSGQRRREIFAEYKSGRKTRKSLTRVFEFLSPEQEKENFKMQLLKLKEYFSILPVYQMEIENLEADDVIAYISNNLFKNDRKIIVSSDRDYYQLISENVLVYRPVKKELMGTESVLKETGCSPRNFAIYKSILGDPSDGIPQIKKGLGSKTIMKMFPFLAENNIYSIEDIINFAKTKNEDEKYSFLNEDIQKILRRNYEIIQLKNYDINTQSIEKIRGILINQKPVLSSSQIMISFLRDSLHSQVKRYDDWRKVFYPLNSQLNPLNEEKDIL
jgi:5'-3' exonuclease